MILFALLLSMPGVADAQEWEVYVSRQDDFSVNFPGQPRIMETTWQTQLGYTLPAPGASPVSVRRGTCTTGR